MISKKSLISISGRQQVISKKNLHPKTVMKSSFSPQELRKYRGQTPIWVSIYTPVAPSLLISSRHSPRLGGHNFCLGRTSGHLGGHGPGMPPVAPGLLCCKLICIDTSLCYLKGGIKCLYYYYYYYRFTLTNLQSFN